MTSSPPTGIAPPLQLPDVVHAPPVVGSHVLVAAKLAVTVSKYKLRNINVYVPILDLCRKVFIEPLYLIGSIIFIFHVIKKFVLFPDFLVFLIKIEYPIFFAIAIVAN